MEQFCRVVHLRLARLETALRLTTNMIHIIENDPIVLFAEGKMDPVPCASFKQDRTKQVSCFE